MASMCTAESGANEGIAAASACAARTWPLPALTLRISSLVMRASVTARPVDDVRGRLAAPHAAQAGDELRRDRLG